MVYSAGMETDYRQKLLAAPENIHAELLEADVSHRPISPGNEIIADELRPHLKFMHQTIEIKFERLSRDLHT